MEDTLNHDAKAPHVVRGTILNSGILGILGPLKTANPQPLNPA